MMTTRPLPPTPYRGPIISTGRPLPPTPAARPPPPQTSSTTLSPVLKRRPHTRRLQAAPSVDLPPVSEEDEGDIAEVDEPEPLIKPRRRPRPTPLIPPRSYTASKLPLILEIPDAPVTFQEQTTKTCDLESFALSPSTLLTRRRSETIFDFPVPPLSLTSPSRTPVTPPNHSPTPSNISLASTSSNSSSPYPLTPHPSDDDQYEHARSSSEKVDECQAIVEAFEEALDVRSPGPPRRSASVLSLRSFNTTEFDTRVEGIYTSLHPRQAAVAQAAQAPKEDRLQVPAHSGARSPHLILSVLDTTHGGSFEVPLMLGSFLSPPSSPCSPTSDDGESDGEGIPICWSESESDDAPLEAALSSSEDDASDNEGPSRAFDPTFRSGTRSSQRSPMQRLEPVELDLESPDTPSVYSMASPVQWDNERTPPRESLVPCDVASTRAPSPLLTSPRASSPRPPSPLHPAGPQLRSRFSTSTLASLPESPNSSSSTHAFFARLTGRGKPSSPSKADRIPFSPRSDRPSFGPSQRRASLRRRTHIPASPAPSAFSFSTHSSSSRSSLDSADSCSCTSEESSGSTGLRRPPIPIELFLRG